MANNYIAPTSFNVTTNPVTEVFGKLLQTVTIAKLSHLSINGAGAYAAHMALGELYDELGDLTDTLIETYQGKYGIVGITVPEAKKCDMCSCIKDVAGMLETKATTIFKDSWVLNQIDEIIALLYHICYKLTNLK